MQVVCEGVKLTECDLGFKWSDSFNQNESGHHDDWTFERAAILFSLAAIYAFCATHTDRSNDEGKKVAKSFFELAAGTLEILKEERKVASWKGSDDLAEDTLSALKALMLAQAMKCFFEKARDDGKPNGILSKLCTECFHFYDECSNNISRASHQHRPIAAMSKEWLDLVESNKHLFDGLQHFYLAKVHEEKNEYGKQLCRLTYATSTCARAVNACSAGDAVRQQFLDAHTMCKAAHERAKKDNDNIYYEKVPDFATFKLQEPAIRLKQPLVQPVLPEVTSFEDPEPLPAPPPPEPVAAPAAPPAVPTAAPSESVPAPPPSALVADELANLSVSSADAPPPAFAEVRDLQIKKLVEMGFTAEDAGKALDKANGSMEAAMEALLANATS